MLHNVRSRSGVAFAVIGLVASSVLHADSGRSRATTTTTTTTSTSTSTVPLVPAFTFDRVEAPVTVDGIGLTGVGQYPSVSP